MNSKIIGKQIIIVFKFKLKMKKLTLTTFFIGLFCSINAQLAPFSGVIDFPSEPFILDKIINQKSGNDFYGISSDGFFVHLDSNATVVHSMKYVDQVTNSLKIKWYDIEVSTDSTFYVIGRNETGSTNFGVIAEINLSGSILWSKKIGGISSSVEFPSICHLNDSSFVYAGKSSDSTLYIGILNSFSTIEKSFQLNNNITNLPKVERITDSTFCVVYKKGYNESEVSIFDNNGNSIKSYVLDSIIVSGIESLSQTGALCTFYSEFDWTKKGYFIINQFGDAENFVKLDAINDIMEEGLFDIEIENDSNLYVLSGFTNNWCRINKIALFDTVCVSGQYSAEAKNILFSNSNQVVVLAKGPLFGVKNNFSFLHNGIIRLDSVDSWNNNCYYPNGKYSYSKDTILVLNTINSFVETTPLNYDIYFISTSQVNPNFYYGCVDFYDEIIENEDNFIHYPNPVIDYLKISKINDSYSKFFVIDLNGIVVKESNLENGENWIDLNAIQPGMYMIYQTDYSNNIKSKTYILEKL